MPGVVSCDPPPQDVENYIHRIGRTGRASRKGTSLTYMTSDDARFGTKLIRIMEEAGQEVSPELRRLAEEGRLEKSQARSKRGPAGGQGRYGRPHGQRSYGYRGLGNDDEGGFGGRSQGYRSRAGQWGRGGGASRGEGGERGGRRKPWQGEWD